MRSLSVRLIAVGAVLGAIGVLVSCSEVPQRLNAPPQGSSDQPHSMQDTYVYMHDNAMLAEMSMSASHFVPNRSEPNALGLRRLMRYAELLKEFGGQLHYDGLEDPEPLVSDRVERIRAYLAEAGVDPNSFSVEVGVAGGQGMTSQEAVVIRDYSKFTPEQATRQEKGGDWEAGKTGMSK